MHHIFRLIDGCILRIVQKLADHIQDWTGASNSTCATVAYRLTFISVFYSALLEPDIRFLQDAPQIELMKVLATLIVLAPFFLVLRVVRLFEQNITKGYSVSSRARNPLEIHPFGRGARDAAWIFCILHSYSGLRRVVGEGVQLYQTFWFGHAILNLLYIYFASCTPKPPKPKEEKVDITRFAPEGA